MKKDSDFEEYLEMVVLQMSCFGYSVAFRLIKRYDIFLVSNLNQSFTT